MDFLNKYDLIVIGGGPAGTTLSSLVAKSGHNVLLIEKDHFPRHQIGESLLPATVHGICRLLGVEEELHGAGFQRKHGGTFLWGNSSKPWTFTFSKAPNSPTGFAYQVERSKFDKILLDNAARLGVEVFEGYSVQDIIVSEGRISGITCRDPDGEIHNIGATFVADASGHQSRFHRIIGDRIFSSFFKNVALYGYFRNGKRLPEPMSGNILCVAFHDGWFWYIPLSTELTSVGAVVSASAAQAIQNGREAAFHDFISACPLIREYLSSASRIVGGPYGEIRLRKDYSYCNTRFYGRGLILVGDAACFVDPVFSSGVHLATYSALLASRSINSTLLGSLEEGVCFDEFEYRYRREFSNFYQFLQAFYDVHRDEHSYFWEARKILRSNASPEEAFVKLVAGLSQEDEPTFSRIDFTCATERAHQWFGTVPNMDSEQARTAQSGVSHFDFDGTLTTEILQVQLQGFLGANRPRESPLREGGLVPSHDGFHWVNPAN